MSKACPLFLLSILVLAPVSSQAGESRANFSDPVLLGTYRYAAQQEHEAIKGKDQFDRKAAAHDLLAHQVDRIRWQWHRSCRLELQVNTGGETVLMPVPASRDRIESASFFSP